MQITWQIVRLQLKETFSISYGSYSFREALIVSLSKNGKQVMANAPQLITTELIYPISPEIIRNSSSNRKTIHKLSFRILCF